MSYSTRYSTIQSSRRACVAHKGDTGVFYFFLSLAILPSSLHIFPKVLVPLGVGGGGREKCSVPTKTHSEFPTLYDHPCH